MSVRVEKDGPVTTVILDRPTRRNAVDGPTAAALADAFRDFERDPAALVGVFHGANGTFSAGADLKAVATRSGANRIHPQGDGPMGPSRMVLSKPVIAAVAGYAVAGGLELALWCDLRVVEESAVMGVFCRRWGVPLIDGGTARLPRLIGLSRAMDMILTGRAVDAQEAYGWGLANRVVPDGTSRAAAETLAHQLARFPQVCMRGDRMSAYEQFAMDLPAAILNEFEHGLAALETEAINGAMAFDRGAGRHGAFEATPAAASSDPGDDPVGAN